MRHGRPTADDDTAAPAVSVRTVRTELPRVDGLAAYLALAGRSGRDDVFLFESATGPDRSRTRQVVGFGVLLTVSVTRGVVRIDGVPALVELALRRADPLLVRTGGGGLRLAEPRGLWPLLRALRDCFAAEGSGSRFRFGFFGCFGYDTARYIEDLPLLIEQEPDFPDVHLAVHQGCVVTEPGAAGSELLLHESAAWPPLPAADTVALLAAAVDPAGAAPAEVPDAVVSDGTDRDRFVADVERCIRHIAVGDIYQVQIGHELTMESPIDPVDVYRRLRERNPSPYMHLAGLAGHTLVGASPELFVRITDGTVLMRPIAGSVPRTGSAAGDAAAVDWLRADPKELAEHTMLVDLCRNDIGRICRADTLAVPEELVVEGYSHVQHLVSTVTGAAAEDADAFDVIPALFPAGTVSGTPKVRAMEIIEDVEPSRRAAYAGALGLIDVGGHVDLALCIRQLSHRAGRYRTRASAGIVADSVPGREWTETLAKSSAAYWAVTGRELL